MVLANAVNASAHSPDLFFCSDMLNVPLFLALVRHRFPHVPTAIYFHENQITYPWSLQTRKRAHVQRTLGLLNYTSAYVADRCFFNSDFHKQNFLESLEKFRSLFPDNTEPCLIKREHIEDKCNVLHVGMDLGKLAQFKQEGLNLFPDITDPIILWNHRWDYDKNPAAFFSILQRFKKNNIRFRLVVCGQPPDVISKVFVRAKEEFQEEILHWGYTESFRYYAALLWRADCSLITSNQDFFGISAVESAYCGCRLFLPNRLSFPEIFSKDSHPELFYSSYDDLFTQFSNWSKFMTPSVNLQKYLEKFSWNVSAPLYDAQLGTIKPTLSTT